MAQNEACDTDKKKGMFEITFNVLGIPAKLEEARYQYD